MQFIPDGPDIPETLLQAHEDGHLIFFCGAGVSYNVGLNDFKWLVDRVYAQLGITYSSTELAAYSNEQYDRTLNILEARLDGQRREMRMRKEIATALQPDFSQPGATETHLALLQLGRTNNGALRLVTTNFDRAFQETAVLNDLQCNSYTAPMLPIPKNSQWDGLVYLHGLLPENVLDERALGQLVVTSGDFGLAYLTERWAARFVSELLRNYTICFIGYSLTDPVMRYMLDALAADRLRGEATRSAYAMGSFDPQISENREEVSANWLSKGVLPILYSHDHGHSLLHYTLKVWASGYRDGILGKERVVTEYAVSNPTDSTKQDDFVGRMLWALSDKSGLPAKRFASFNPVPPFTWLETFSNRKLGHDDLVRFGVSPDSDEEDNVQFSLVNRPAPGINAPWMVMVAGLDQWCRWDKVMYQLARWVTRHLNNPKLAIWLADNGGNLNPEFTQIIEHHIENYEKLRVENKSADLKDIFDQAPDAIPNSRMRTIWRLFITNRIKLTRHHSFDLYGWKERIERDGLTASLRIELRTLLAPKVKLKNSFYLPHNDDGTEEHQTIEQLIDWELVLATDYADTVLINEPDELDENWRSIFAHLLDEFQLLLNDALDLLGELGRADNISDRSFWDLPSISSHWQNRHIREWVLLIELLRISWLVIYDKDPNRAKLIARGWFELPYPTYKRLAFFAASQDDCIPADVWSDWLMEDDSWWLWSSETQRETMRLLVLQSHKLSAGERSRIEAAILKGPPRVMFREDMDPDEFERMSNNTIGLLLAKFTFDEKLLSPEAQTVLQTVSTEHSDWHRIRGNERYEFPFWISGTGDPDYEENLEVDVAPRKTHELVNWLKQPPKENRPNHVDTWAQSCQSRFCHSLYALDILSQEGVWPSNRWRVALQVWGERKQLHRPWRCVGPLLQNMTDETLSDIAHDLATWLQRVSKSVDLPDLVFLKICSRVLDIATLGGVLDASPVTLALNHPVGMVTQAMLDYWFRLEPNDNDSLPEDLKQVLTRICVTDKPQYVHGRVILASRLIALFRVDRIWTEEHLLPFFDWTKNENEAKAMWEGFLWSPRIYPPLMFAFKTYFLDTVNHYDKLEDSGPQFIHCLTFAAVETLDGFQSSDFQCAMNALPIEAILHAAQAVLAALEGSGSNREQYWENRVQPFWQRVWPKAHDLASSKLAETLVFLSIAAQGKFPVVLQAVIGWLQPIEYPYYVVSKLNESGLCSQFPNETLDLLSRIVNGDSFLSEDLRQCLDTVSRECEGLVEDRRYKQLDTNLRIQGF